MAPPKFMKDVVAVLSGTFGDCKHSQAKSYLEQHGGKVSPSMSEKCTHLVTTQKDVDGNKPKVQRAADFPDIKIVSIEWLLDSVREKKRLNEVPYNLTKPGSLNKPSNGTSQPAGKAKKPTPANSQTGSNTSMAIDLSSDDVMPKDSKVSKVASKKRSLSDSVSKVKTGIADSQADEPPTKKMKDGQKAKSGSLHVAVDENCPFASKLPSSDTAAPFNSVSVLMDLAASHRVYITEGKDDYPKSTIMDVTLNQTDIVNNANKFYRLQVLTSMSSEHYICWTRWGRVGEGGQSKELGDGTLEGAFAAFEKKFKDKTGHKWINRYDPPKKKLYTFIERDYEESSSEIGDDDEIPGAGSRRSSNQSNQSNKSIQCTLPQPVQGLMEMIFNQQYFAQTLDAMNYDAAKLPLGKLSKRTLNNGFTILKSLAQVVANPTKAMEDHGMDYGQAIEHLTNQYYTTIPHVFGRNRPPMINTEQMIKREVDLLEALTDMEIADEIMKGTKLENENGDIVHPLDRQFAGLGLQEMTPLKRDGTEFLELENYLVNLKGSTHGVNFKVQDIFRIERNGENDHFQKSEFSKVKASDRRLLWHGSRCTNFGGILSQGLRIAPPEAPVSGYMFGKGVYLADISTKSANYCYPSMSANVGLLLLCEAELGKPMLELTNADYNAGDNAKAKGCLTTFGQGQMRPAGWKDAGCVHESLKGVRMPNAKLRQTNGADGGNFYQLLYNEYIAYDIAQIRLRYLFRVEMKNVY